MVEAASVLSDDSRVPLYHQIFLILKAKILTGEFSPGEFLPGERDLAEMYDVSRITTVRALKELVRAGLVVRERGRGTRVQIVAQGSVARGPAAEASNAPRNADEASAPEIDVIAFEYLEAPAEIQRALGIGRRDEVQWATRLLRYNGAPYAHAESFVPKDVGEAWTREDLESTPMFVLLERAGVSIGLVQERVSAVLADKVFAERLDIKSGSPLIYLERTTFDIHDRAIDYFRGYYAPDRYQYVVTLPQAAASQRRRRYT